MNQADQEAINGIYKPLLEASIKELPPEEPKLVTDRVPQPNPQLIEPKPSDIVLCTYPDTLDGRLAAWVVRGIAQTHKIPVEFVFGPGTTKVEDVQARNVIEISPSVSRVSVRYTGKYKSLLIVRDTKADGSVSLSGDLPLEFSRWKRTFPFGIETMTRPMSISTNPVGILDDPSKSLAAAAWDFFYADRVGFDKRPRLVDYVNDSATRNAFNDTAAVVACLNTYPKDFQTLDKLAEACDDRKRLAFIVTSGQAVLRYIAQRRDEVDQD